MRDRPASGELHGMAAVVVTYRPDIELLSMLLQALPPEVRLVVVDNGSAPAETAEMDRLLSARERARLLGNEGNRGLAAAINQGVAALRGDPPEFLLLLDQDSVPQPGALAALRDAFLKLEAEGEAVGCVGPRLFDPATGLEHGFHAMRGPCWVRVFPGEGCVQPVRCANLNGSGTVVRMALFERMGGLDEALFIDHVDTDWSFRVLGAGLGLFGIPQAAFHHSMGERGSRIWFMGWRVWPIRSPQRHYFLFRNSITLLRRSYVPAVWKFWAVAKLAGTLVGHALLGDRRVAQVGHMLRGVKDGLRSNA
jgi:rhamnosyltransferase